MKWNPKKAGVALAASVLAVFALAEWGVQATGVELAPLVGDELAAFYLGLFTGIQLVALTFGLGLLGGLLLKWRLASKEPGSGKAKESKRERLGMDDEAVSPVIGVVLMVAVTVVLAAIVFVIVSDLSVVEDQAPRMAFRSDGEAYVVHSASDGVAWEDLDVEGCQVVPTGVVEAGDRIEDCTDPVTVRHIPSNSLVWSS